MFETVKIAARKIIPRHGKGELIDSDVHHARRYIDRYWKKLERHNPKDNETLIGLPNPYLVPAFEEGHSFDFNEMYYWDSYFMVQSMLDKKHKKFVLGILDNLLTMYERFKIIPNASRTYLMGRSQPPLLTSLIFDVYDAYHMDEKWLEKCIKIAKDEYYNVWMGDSKPNWRQVYKGLSRYYDINMLHDLAEAESGWDMTPRFGRKALNYLPVDLNSLLYKYETDFARAAKIFDNEKEEHQWNKRASERALTMTQLMWSETRGLFYDYNFVKETRGGVASLASYYPMWAGLATDKQAAKLVKSLSRFDNKGGLATTDNPMLNQLVPGSIPTQWAHPNGWAPLHFLIIKGLEEYGYQDEARKVAMKWLKTNLGWFNKHSVFLEKYNVVQPNKPPVKGVYPSQTGFGWTNAVFERLCQEYIDKK